MAPTATATATANSFADLGVEPWLVKSLSAMAIRRPTPIQANCIPPIIQGKDCIGGSRTGSGKTIAFAVPILQMWSQDPFGVFALVLTPTRELAIQIAEQLTALGSPQNLKTALLIGGVDMRQQALTLSKRPHVVVATPGRLADHIRCSGEDTICGLRKVRVVVMDEADRLLSGNYASDLLECMSIVPGEDKGRQTLLFSATLSDEIRALKEKRAEPSSSSSSSSNKRELYVSDLSGDKHITVPPTLEQTFLLKPSQVHLAFLHALLETPLNVTKSVIIFTNRAWTAELVMGTLKLLGHRVTSLHSNLSQRERIDSLGRFRASAARILIATDVASRGLDIPSVEMVVNFDVPRDPRDYIHRVGRTARAGRKGEAITFVKERDLLLVRAIEETVGKPLEPYKEEEGVSLEGRVVREHLKKVSEARRTTVLSLEEPKDSKSRKRQDNASERASKRSRK